MKIEITLENWKSLLQQNKNTMNIGNVFKMLYKKVEVHPEIINETAFCPEDTSIKVRLLYIINDISEVNLCIECSHSINDGGKKSFCSHSCRAKNQAKNSEILEKRSKTYTEQWNKKSEDDKNKIKEKRRNGVFVKYGVDHNFKISGFKEKRKQTWLKKYGNEIAQKSISVKEKAKQTCMQRYGSVTPLGNSAVKKKWFSAFETKHGARNPMYIDLFKRKSVATKLNLNPNDIIFTKERTFDFDNRQISYKEYSKTVRALTAETLLKDGNNYFGNNWKNKIGRFKNHVDHKLSIKSAFIDGVNPSIVANIKNLHILPWQDNLLKGSKDLISINELLLLIENKNKQ